MQNISIEITVSATRSTADDHRENDVLLLFQSNRRVACIEGIVSAREGAAPAEDEARDTFGVDAHVRTMALLAAWQVHHGDADYLGADDASTFVPNFLDWLRQHAPAEDAEAMHRLIGIALQENGEVLQTKETEVLP